MTNSQADNLIQSGRPLKEIIPLFPNKIAACQYFAATMTKMYSAPDSQCCMCGQACKEPPVLFVWRANLHTAKSVFFSFLFSAVALFAHHIYSRWLVVDFTTFHRLCPQCERHHHRIAFGVSVSHKVLFAALILLLFLTVPAGVFAVAMPFIAPEGIKLFLPLFVVGLILTALVARGFEACRRWLIPQGLRTIGRFPFFLYALKKAE